MPASFTSNYATDRSPLLLTAAILPRTTDSPMIARDCSRGIALTEQEPPKVFISYSHDSADHAARVLKLANVLRRDGVDAIIDQYVTFPAEGWPAWMDAQIRDNDFVIMVCSASYFRRIVRREASRDGLGVAWEGSLIYNHIYITKGDLSRFVPVLLNDGSLDYIPELLRAGGHYLVETQNGYEGLLRRLFRLPTAQVPPIGIPPSLSQFQALWTTQPIIESLAVSKPIKETSEFHATDSDRSLSNYPLPEVPSQEPTNFSASITRYFHEINRDIELLTNDQYRVIRNLRYKKRQRVCGCAGSGKTLVAVEKAIRLAQAGMETLFLCHNPHLARYVSDLTFGVPIQIYTFSCWIATCVSISEDNREASWSYFEEPDTDTLNIAFDILIEKGGCFDAIIVDEGQDFRGEWWTTVEAGLRRKEHGVLYIFHDDRQALLPYRSDYPIEDLFELSRNCRNAGVIFELLRPFHWQLPRPEVLLRDKGLVAYFDAKKQEVISDLEAALTFLSHRGVMDCSIVVLLAGGLTIANSGIIDRDIYVRMTEPWQRAVRRYFESGFRSYPRSGIRTPVADLDEVKRVLDRLSDERIPTSGDIQLVVECANLFSIDRYQRRKILENPSFRSALRWCVKGQKLFLSRSDPAPLWAAEIIMHFERGDWAVGLPGVRVFKTVKERGMGDPRAVSIYELHSFKGLEADTIILIDGGYKPMSEEELYVAISRPRCALILIDCGGIGTKMPTVRRYAAEREKEV